MKPGESRNTDTVNETEETEESEENKMYQAAENRYDGMRYNRCGKSGIRLPALSLGLWHNFGAITDFGTQQKILRTAFDNGITHFDLANNYGPPYGEAERNFGIHMDRDWKPYRDELIISTKAGFDMWKGPYGDHGSRKYLMASLDQSLQRMHLDYVDIFYHHRPDPETPIEETMGALYDIVKSGKALYAGISNYNAEQTAEAVRVLREMGMQVMVPGTIAGTAPSVIYEINGTVEVAGMQVKAGDIVHMDNDGAVKFPGDMLDQVLREVEIEQQSENELKEVVHGARNLEECINAYHICHERCTPTLGKVK